MYTLDNFYTSKEWARFRRVVIHDRLNDEGQTICEYCHRPIVRAYDIILHHKQELTEENVNDAMIAFNPDNIMLVHHRCHNYIHDKLGHREYGIYLIYGPPLSGKSSYVEEVSEPGDLIIDMDSIWQCVSGCERYSKPPRLNAVAFGVRDYLLDCVKYRRGKWKSAYLIGGFPLISERERICKELGAREIFIECSKGDCINRLYNCGDGREMSEWIKYIDDWFLKYIPPL